MKKQKRQRLEVENLKLRSALQVEQKRSTGLREINTQLRIELNATDIVLASAFDELRGDADR
jgi:hypothetical protein